MSYEDRNRVEGWHLTDSFTPLRYSQMVRSFKTTPQSILDIGIGSGVGGSILRARFPKSTIIGLDAVEERTLSDLSQYDDVKYGLAAGSIFERESFDLIVAGELIEHIEPSEVDLFLREVFKILNPGGIFIFTTPNPSDVKSRIKKRSVLGGSHVSQHYIRETKIRLRMESFRVIKVEGTGNTSRFIGRKFPKFLYGSYMIYSSKR